ncbi:MAG: ATP-dependent DNA helicase RecG [Acidimicrobiaceae bacterium]|nr:ATP-dependent DNA helicase RecG [Acidimicrobiaceae bacterium]
MQRLTSPLTLSDLDNLPVSRLKGVGAKKETALKSIGIETVLDVLSHYPRRYIDRTKEAKIGALQEGEEGMVLAEVLDVQTIRTRNRKKIVRAEVTDGTGILEITFFNQPWRARQLQEEMHVVIFGKLDIYRGKGRMTNPVVDLVGDKTGRIVPVYQQSGKAGLSTWEIGAWVADALHKSRVRGFADPLPLSIRHRHNLVDRTTALTNIHNPTSIGETIEARNRLVFDELLRIQLVLVARKRIFELANHGIAHDFQGKFIDLLLSTLPFQLTGAQIRVINEITGDLQSQMPMHRLLQGDVGSGKTLVAVAGLLGVVEGGRQGVIMAPTEVLAEQHYLGISGLIDSMKVPCPETLMGERPLRIELLTSRTGQSDRNHIIAGLSRGSVDIVIGTHSLIQEGVEFKNLGLTVIDEQHRFGVDQRAALRAKASGEEIPDLLVMTATPIPRTAAMTVYGDLDVSILDELPPGRTPISTKWVEDDSEVWEKVRSQIAKGKQAYVVCPLIGENETTQKASVEKTHKRLIETELKGLEVDLLHGRLTGPEKYEVMTRFRDGATDVLISTTVIEVGVDVPNATVMVILDAERFGIAQLHQLRGRVGRGDMESWCFLVSGARTDEAVQRLTALESSTDGFELAEIDLEIRGEGTIMGVIQKGRNDLRLASLRRDKQWVEHARDAAIQLLDLPKGNDDISLLIEEVEFLLGGAETEYLFKS